MKRLIVAVLMLAVGLSLVGSAEAFCVDNKTDDKFLATVKVTRYVGTTNTEQTTYVFPVKPNGRSCEDRSETFRIIDVNVTVTYESASIALCSFTTTTPKDIEITKVKNQLFCSQKT